jgi:hypothetical protein
MYAIAVGELDAFTVNLEGWAQGKPPTATAGLTRQLLGGPDGVGDPFMRIVSTGGGGSYGKLIAFNVFPAWTGNYLAAGVSTISMSVNNFGATDLKLRVALGSVFVPENPGTWFASLNPILLPAGSGWTMVQFPLDAASLSRRPGDTETYESVLSNVLALRLMHSDDPDARGTPIAATLGVDNIMALGAASIPGDFDDNNVVNGADLALWRTDFGAGGGSDADNDSDIDGADFLIWQRNLGAMAPSANMPVPEPASLLATLCWVTALIGNPARVNGLAGRPGA